MGDVVTTIVADRGYHEALAAAAADPSVRVVVVTGRHGAFAVDEAIDVAAAGPLHALSVPKPLVAAVNGRCEGDGLIEALLCDIRFTSTDGRFMAPWARLGRTAPESAAWVLGRVVGVGAAMDMLLSGRELDATEAAVIGLVQDVFEPEELLPAVVAYARRLASSTDPDAVAAIKAQAYRALELGLGDAIAEARTLAERFRG